MNLKIDSFSSKFLYKCRYANVYYNINELCTNYSKLCSNIPHCTIMNCPRGDDEIEEICKSIIDCPKNCICSNPSEMICKNGKIFLKENSSLKYYLRSFYIENVNGQEILQTMKKIREFYLVAVTAISSNLTDETLILPFPNLKYLNLSSNSIKTLKNQYFLTTVSLEKLIFSNNKFKLINENSLENLNNLKILVFENSNINYLNKNLFKKSYKLKILKIQNSKILEFDDNFLSTFVNLEELNLRKSYFHKQNDISRLNFQSNEKLRKLNSEYFIICCFLKEHQNNVECLPENVNFFTCGNLIGSLTKKGEFEKKLKKNKIFFFLQLYFMLLFLSHFWEILF